MIHKLVIGASLTIAIIGGGVLVSQTLVASSFSHASPHDVSESGGEAMADGPMSALFVKNERVSHQQPHLPSEPAVLLVKNKKRTAVAPAFQSNEQLQFEKSQPRGQLPAIKPRPTKEELETLITNHEDSQKAARNAQMFRDAKRDQPSGHARPAVPKGFKSAEELKFEKSEPQGTKPAIQRHGERTMELEKFSFSSDQRKATRVVQHAIQDDGLVRRLAFSAQTFLSFLNPFSVSEANAESPSLSLVLSPTSMVSGSNFIMLFGGRMFKDAWHFFNSFSATYGHSNVRPYVLLSLHIEKAGYYTVNFRTYGNGNDYKLTDHTGEEIESWHNYGGNYTTWEQATILELEAGHHYFYFHQERASGIPRFLEVTVDSL